MNNKSRTKNATKNALIGIITQLIIVLLEFIGRTIFIKVLGSEYLGVNGLFTNILTILSFAELGIGNAIIFSLYKEVANDNKKKINSLLLLYKKTYKTIGITVLIVGIIIMPVLPYIINGELTIDENLYLIYSLFLINTTISYFCSYKKSVLSAYQQEYYNTLSKLISEIIKVGLQTLLLFTIKNFILYLIVQILCTFINNIIATVIANKKYSFIKKVAEPLDTKEKKQIFNNVKSLVLYKFGSIILNGTDNIIISSMINIVNVGLLANYNLLVNTINGLIGSALNGIVSSVGNLNTSNDYSKQENIFYQLFLMCTWIYGFCAISFFVLSESFIKIWIGHEYILPTLVVLAISLHIYINGVQFVGYTYRTTAGLFNKGKFCPIIAAILNIILSIILCKIIGLAGVLFATSISRLLTTTWYDIYMAYKFIFNKNPIPFYIKYLRNILIVLIVGLINYYLISLIFMEGIVGLIVKSIVSIIVINILFLSIFFKTKEYKQLLKRGKELLWKKKEAI